MRLVRRVLLLLIAGVAGVVAYAYWSGDGSLREQAVALGTKAAQREAAKVASGVAEKAGGAAETLGTAIKDGALTAKIKSKMALDDHVNARAISVDTAGSVVTLSGVVRSVEEQRRAVQLARETEGITRVVDQLEIGTP